MNKKATAYPMERVVGISILLVVLIVLGVAFFAPEGWLNAIAEKAEGFARFIPGREEVKHVPGLDISENLKESYDGLYKKFDELERAKDEKCWSEYNEIPTLGKNKIEMRASEEGLNMWITNEKGQKILAETVPNLKPCIIAGTAEDNSNVADNFVKYYSLSNKDPTKPEEPPENEIYTEFKLAEIIKPRLRTDIGADGVAYNLDHPILYKYNLDHICFIPNFKGWGRCHGKEEGLDNDCINQIKKLDKCQSKR